MRSIRNKKSLVEETYDSLLAAITSGELGPGERLNQDQLAEQLNVSRQPVNSAIAILKANGLLHDNGKRGVIVAPIDPQYFVNIYEFRLIVEPSVAKLAADRKPDNAEAEAEEIMKLGQSAVEKADSFDLIAADAAFHRMIYQWAGNTVVAQSLNANWHHVERFMGRVLSDEKFIKSTWKDHRMILEHILTGKGDLAEVQMRDHIHRAKESTLAALMAHEK
ncbi:MULTISPECIES: GntR family transcriptional regulator [unclassified Roseobacter]|uniref:GntR family transcriptional regulator n=1 Tax=unclassified Roseobacter TaxID=196798 RepID=UPI0030ED6527